MANEMLIFGLRILKSLIIMLFLATLSMPVNAQQSKIDYNYLNGNFDYLKRAQKQARTGGVLMLTGIGAVIGGVVLFNNYGQWNERSGYGPNKGLGDSQQTIWYPIGFLVSAGGFAIFGIGVSNLIPGCVKIGKAKKNLRMTTVSYRLPGTTEPIYGIVVKIRL
jgi:hypothetical protein